MFILTVSVCVCADSRKAASQEQPKYELKSDIINFDYSQLAYPSSKPEVGIKIDSTVVPKKLVPGKPEEIQPVSLDDVLNGLLLAFGFFLGAASIYAFSVFTPFFVVQISALMCRTIRKYKENNKN
jgi:hypothetical protein